MASLIGELVSVLNKENEEYEQMLALSQRKTPVIVQGDIATLQEITEEEQKRIDVITQLEKDRMACLVDIGKVIGREAETIMLADLVRALDRSPADQRELDDAHRKLKETLKHLNEINSRNRELLSTALEMVEFDLNIMRASKQAPETANYNRGAYNAGSMLGAGRSGFDAKS